ncbi:MAG: hypothetical protein BWY09_01558 [Candidatus Hydrogenedentes bacterium ADurb.Bin179]|nr:MAG: hypothetical protein BWY09_01558 [Candidatus Hydrogenedentes bacterium ADurb.Bin179]
MKRQPGSYKKRGMLYFKILSGNMLLGAYGHFADI